MWVSWMGRAFVHTQRLSRSGFSGTFDCFDPSEGLEGVEGLEVTGECVFMGLIHIWIVWGGRCE